MNPVPHDTIVLWWEIALALTVVVLLVVAGLLELVIGSPNQMSLTTDWIRFVEPITSSSRTATTRSTTTVSANAISHHRTIVSCGTGFISVLPGHPRLPTCARRPAEQPSRCPRR